MENMKIFKTNIFRINNKKSLPENQQALIIFYFLFFII